MPVWLWLAAVLGAAFIVLLVRSSRRKAQDRAVLQEFRQWSGGGSQVDGDPVCPGCRTIYNRQEVVRLLRQQSPEMFEFGSWSTKFVCKACGAHVGISGSH